MVTKITYQDRKIAQFMEIGQILKFGCPVKMVLKRVLDTVTIQNLNLMVKSAKETTLNFKTVLKVSSTVFNIPYIFKNKSDFTVRAAYKHR